MADRVRVAMIGAGAMANLVHYPSLASFADVEIVAICDLDTARLQATADKYHVVKRFRSYRRMVAEVEPQAVYAIGPPHLMFDVWTWCLQAGLHLYVEKPPGVTLHQAQVLADLAAAHGCITQVSFQRRAAPIHTMLRAECLKCGPIIHGVCEFYKCAPTPFFDARDHLLDDGVHAIDTLRWICGGEVVGVHAECRRVAVPDLNFFAVLLSFNNGATGVMLNSWTSGRRIFRVQMHALGICAEVELENCGYLYADGKIEGRRYETREVAGSQELFVFGGFQAKNREFIDCVKSGQQPSSNFADALKTMTVVAQIQALDLVKGLAR